MGDKRLRAQTIAPIRAFRNGLFYRMSLSLLTNEKRPQAGVFHY